MRLWALDRVEPSLAALTRGEGPGAKFENCNRLRLADAPSDSWVVVLDDDVVFQRGDVVSLVGAAAMGGLDLSQPTHAAGSFHSYAVTRYARRSVARLTGFVEIGPAFAVSPRMRARVLPFPDVGMGWGLEAAWSRLVRDGFRLGEIDICRMRHTTLAGTDYDRAPEFARRDAFLAAHGVATMEELAHATVTWSTVQVRGAPWVRSEPA